MPRSYNPLDYESISESLARELMSSELVGLDQVERFPGDGVYVLFYSGDFPAYSEMARVNSVSPGSLPIYIGKACPKVLTGNVPVGGDGEERLYRRVTKDHRKSIEQAANLELSDFSCRLLVLNSIWVPLAESALIARYAPIWNSVITGFGNHDPGKGRRAGMVSRWDTLHPGRGRGESPANGHEYDELCGEACAAIAERVRVLGL